MGATTDIYASGGLTVDTAQLSVPAGTPGGQIRVLKDQTLTIQNSGTVTADLLELGNGTWKVTTGSTNSPIVTIKANQITMSDPWKGKFGKDDGTAATALAAPFEEGKATNATTYTASGAKVTLGQSGNGLTITGASSSARLITGATAGFWVKAGLRISSVTLDMSADSDWCSVIYLADDPGITLAGSDSVLLFNKDSEGGDPPSSTYLLSNHSDINAKITIGTAVEVRAIWNNNWYESGTNNERFASFTGASTDNTITRSESNTIWLTKRLKFKD
jgi:hypothetical protein